MLQPKARLYAGVPFGYIKCHKHSHLVKYFPHPFQHFFVISQVIPDHSLQQDVDGIINSYMSLSEVVGVLEVKIAMIIVILIQIFLDQRGIPKILEVS